MLLIKPKNHCTDDSDPCLLVLQRDRTTPMGMGSLASERV